MSAKILLVDDEADMLSTCGAALSHEGWRVFPEQRGDAALERVKEESFDLLVADIRMPGLTGLELLKAAKSSDPSLPVIMITAFPEFDSALEALRAGAMDFVLKPFHPADLVSRIRRALEERHLKDENRLLARHVAREYVPVEIVGKAPSLLKVVELADKVAATPADVFILGESGTGKELIARRLHARSNRSGHFVPVDCGAIPENLLENEFFGHERGAFTDASRASPGLMELADRGTFFLDEVCELPLSLQAKLLRALQERQIRRVGGREMRGVDLRIIAATNRDVEAEVKAGRFRDDLYYRLNVISLRLPSLRERSEDIPLLARHYLPRICREMGRAVSRIEEPAADILTHYAWPGNIRELINVLKKSVLLCEGETLAASDLPEFLVAAALSRPEGEGPAEAAASGDPASTKEEGFASMKKRHLDSFEKEFLEAALRRRHGNAKAAAEDCGLPLSNFYWYLKKHALSPQSFR